MISEEAGQSPARLKWFKSSYSSGEGGACVEVAIDVVSVHVRDSKDTRVPPLSFRPAEWSAFVDFAAGI